MPGGLRVRLEGPTAILGEVAASDFARVLLGTQSALQRAAGHVIGKQTRQTGRSGKAIEDSTRLRLVAIQAGSVVAELVPPPAPADPGALELLDPLLGERAIDEALATILDVATGHADVADALVRMADDVGLGHRFDAISFDRHADGREYTARLDVPARDRLRLVARPPQPAKDETLVGVLVEADFESLTARLRGSGGQRTSVSFPESLADDVKWALRGSARLQGEVRYDPSSAEVRAIELRRIDVGNQLVLGLDPGDFWQRATVEELAEANDIAAVADPEDLRDNEAADDEVDRMIAALEGM